MKILTMLLCAFTAGSAVGQTLYKPETFQPLVSDRRAYRVGDILTVQIVENASATASADTATEKRAGLGLAVKGPNTDKSLSVDLNDDFSGKGKIQRSGKLLAQLTVNVLRVDPNGYLVIRGDQVIDVNNEKQEIRLEGRVRPNDVGDNNTIQSTRIADARLSYIGKGILGDKQTPGLLSRLFGWLGLL